MKIRFYLSPNPGENGGTAATAVADEVQVAGAAGTGNIVIPDDQVKTLDQAGEMPETLEAYEEQLKKGQTDAGTNAAAGDDKKEKKLPEAGAAAPAEKKEPAAAAATDGEKKKDDKAEPGKETAAAVTDGEATAAGDADESLVFDEKLLTAAAGTESGEEQLTFKGLGETFGATVADETYESFETGMKARLVAEREAGRQEAAAIYTEDQLAQFEPDALDMIKYLSIKGNTLDTYANQLKQYDDILALTPEEQVRLDLKGMKWDQEKIDLKVADMKEKGTLGDEAYRIQKHVEMLKDKEKKQIGDDARNKFELRKQQIATERSKEDAAIESELSRLNQFMGHKLTDGVKKILLDKWKAGEYRGRLRNSATDTLRAILYLELGETAEKNIAKKAFEKGKQGFKEDDVHNLDKQTGSKGGSETPPAEKFEGFDEWAHLMKKEEAARV